MSELKKYPNPRNLKTITSPDHVNLYVDIPKFDGYRFTHVGYPTDGEFYLPLTYIVSNYNHMTAPLSYCAINDYGSQCFIYKKVTKILTSDEFTNLYDVELISEVPVGSRGYIQRKVSFSYHEFTVSKPDSLHICGFGNYDLCDVSKYYCKFAVIELGKRK